MIAKDQTFECWVSCVGFILSVLAAGAPGAAAGVPELSVPAGLTARRVAGPPLVERPMMGGFDQQGRLFIAESAGKNVDFKALSADPPNFIRMLQDSDGDGVFDKSTVFANRMTFPSGALWHEGALYVVSPPSLWKLEDLNDDGVCDRRTEIVTGFGSIGNGADLHGPFLGPDGWLYFCDGRNGHDVTLGDGSRWKGIAAAVYRCRSDGSGLEVVFGGGMDNPVEAVFTPEGEMLVGCNLVMAQPQRLDGILLGIEGGVYPYASCTAEFKTTGDLLSPVGDLGWVSVSGVVRYEGSALGSGFESNLFSAQFNRHRVQRHVVTREGAAFRISSEDFLTCNDPDFHPTDVIEDADGSLLVIDTGGWFRIGCPQSQVEKPNVLGGIYRIRSRHAARVDDPRGLKLDWRDVSAGELVRRLGDPRPAVVERALGALSVSDAAQAELEELAVRRSGSQALSAMWALNRRNTDAGHGGVRRAIGNSDPAARRAAIRAAGLARDQAASGAVLGSLAASDLAESREAAIALGRLKEKSATAPLLAELKRASDRFHEHAVIYALIQTADRSGVAAGLGNPSPAVQRGAMIALDQMSGGDLAANEIIPLLASEHAIVRQEAMRIVSSRPQWAASVSGQLRTLLNDAKTDELTRGGLGAIVTAFAHDAGVQKVVADALGSANTAVDAKLLLLDALAAAPVEEFPSCWKTAVVDILREKDEALVRQAVEVVRSRNLTGCDQELLSISRKVARDSNVRVAALSAAAPRVKLNQDSFSFLFAQLDTQRPLLERLNAAQCLARFSLDDPQLLDLARTMETVGPMELAQLLVAFEHSSNATVGRALVAALNKSKAAAGLPAAVVRQVLAKYPAEVTQGAKPLLEQLDAGASKQSAHLAELAPLLVGGDPSCGQAVFLGKTAGCTTCHAVGSNGAQVGPNLSKIGSMRSGRDLLESIVYPSASIARGFEPFVVETADGHVYAGTLAGESAESIRLKTPALTTIPRSKIKNFRPDRVSIMPQGLDAQLTRQELSDLLAFLQACK